MRSDNYWEGRQRPPYPKNGLLRSFAHAQWACSMGVGMWHIGGGLKRVGTRAAGGGVPQNKVGAPHCQTKVDISVEVFVSYVLSLGDLRFCNIF